MSIHFKEVKYGFEYGSSQVERLCSDDKKKWVIIRVSSPKDDIQVYVTKTGKIRVFGKGEWINPNAPVKKKPNQIPEKDNN